MTENRLLSGTQCLWHRIGRCQKPVQHTKVRCHVAEALEADGTSIMPTGKFGKARGMHKMATTELLSTQKIEGDGKGTGIVDLDGKTAVEDAFST